LSIRSGATLTQGSPCGNGGATMLSVGARTGATVASADRRPGVLAAGPERTPQEEDRVDLWSRLHDVQTRWNVLEHPFYARWSAGELTPAELAVYAGEYRHAVVALAAATDRAAHAAGGDERAALAAHAGEEAAHVALWDGFVAATGGDAGREPAPETAECAQAWAGEGRDLLGHLVAIYAIESAQPAIARVKADGLREHYGLETGPATAYFDLHAVRDEEHAADGRELIARRLDDAGTDPEALAAEAESVLRANWILLDGVVRICAA
jgi:pyrroloquinoline-quinone synthase